MLLSDTYYSVMTSTYLALLNRVVLLDHEVEITAAEEHLSPIDI